MTVALIILNVDFLMNEQSAPGVYGAAKTYNICKGNSFDKNLILARI